MKIRELSIKNCLSFSEKGFNEEGSISLDNFNLFIGSNNSGKSNVLKTIEVLRLILSAVRQQGNDILQDFPVSFKGQQVDWIFSQNPDGEISFSFCLEIEEHDLDIPPYNHDNKNPVEFMFDKKSNWPKIIKMTVLVQYKQGNPYLNITKIEIPNDHPSYKENPILFDKATKTILALKHGPFRDDLVWDFVSPREEKEWRNHFTPVSVAVREFVNQLHNKIIENLIINIPAIREIKATGDEIIESLSSLRDGTPQNRRLEKNVIDFIKSLIFTNESQDISFVYPGQSGNRQVKIQIGDLQLPLGHYGSAVEQMITIVAEIVRHGSNKLVLIEEPEAHFHPELHRKFIRFSRDNQELLKHQYFIATHSNTFIDEFINMNGNIFYVYSTQDSRSSIKYSQVEPFKKDESLKLFKELGVRPSDLLLANGILVVEGPTDKDIFKDWSIKIGKPFEFASIEVIDVEGAGNIHKYLGSEVIQRTCFGNYSICDKNAEDEIRKKLKGIVPDENIIVLEKGDLEDYYPRNLVLDFAREWGNIKGKKEEEIPKEVKEGETVNKLNKLLGGDWWKTKLKDKIIEEMKSEQIDDEIVSKLSQIYDSVY